MTRTYATRSRAVPRAATPDNRELTGESPLFIPPSPTRRSAVTDSERDDVHPAQPRRRSYSDVVARRAPSEEENSDKENKYNPLTLDEEIKRHARTELNREQTHTIRTAENSMTPPERDLLTKRRQNVRDETRAHEPLADLGDGPPKNKGKGVDPRNWGNIHFSDEEETRPDVQEKAYNEWKARQRNYLDTNHRPALPAMPVNPVPATSTAEALNLEILRELKAIRAENARLREQQSDKPAKRKHARVTMRQADPVSISRGMASLATKGVPARDEHAHLRPSNQLPANSYLGRAFQHQPAGNDPSDDPTTSSDASYDPSDSRSSSSDESSNSGSSTDNYRSRRRAMKKKQYRDSKKRACLIKPTPPEPYDGSADSQAFYRFMRESKSYVEEGQVRRKHQVEKLSRYLQGTAYTFYIRQVAFNASEWTLDTFFTSLFDYCFPTNYISKQRKKLKNLYQNGKTVKEYVSELVELFTIIGEISERDKVNTLWFGLRSSIQQDLWKDRRNPETSSWQDVVAAAEVIEIAQSVVVHRHNNTREPRDSNERRGGESSQPRGPNKPFQKNPPKASQPNHAGGNNHRSNNHRNPQSRRNSGNNPPRPEKPRLSEDEISRLKSEGRCFRCKETGHVSRQCPQAHTVRTQSTSRGPPGLPMHGMDMAFIEETEELHEAVDLNDENLDVLPVGSMELVNDPAGPNDQVPLTSTAQAGLIGFYTDACELTLNEHGGLTFPGDSAFPPLSDFWDDHRFSIMQISDDEVVVEDHLQTDHYEYLPIQKLMNPRFNFIHWLAVRIAQRHKQPRIVVRKYAAAGSIGDIMANMIHISLSIEGPYPERLRPEGREDTPDPRRFSADWHEDLETISIVDSLTGLIHDLEWTHLRNPHFNIVGWVTRQTEKAWLILDNEPENVDLGQFFTMSQNDDDPDLVEFVLRLIDGFAQLDAAKSTAISSEPPLEHLELFGQQVKAGTYASLQRNSAVTRDYSRMVPKPVTITVNVNGHPARALIDSGSLGDFISTTLVEQLGLKKIQLQNPLAVQLAVQGSRSKINYGCRAKMTYQNIAEERYFDVINLSNYDMILGTPWLYQHQVTFGINPVNVSVGSSSSQPLKGAGVSTLSS
ncbi:hypothetical protein EYR36_002255 [Pleurotus pulmonarius]|nr:hypothetical protein EYR36_002255 [Pleurotus pulmonarius]